MLASPQGQLQTWRWNSKCADQPIRPPADIILHYAACENGTMR